ncbi:virion structural protein [Croceibacter phage P2559S]|uniref:virion structural protein n=1 Tax=Croceibacter phage P2559S TaxID=1176422 RepID=UPI0002688EA8|nr:virion structural protein [Croceibacter phage P2559S]AFM54791.1 putative phage capsid protein [Croceibacter phage P2559S]
MQNLRAKANLDKWELRPSRYGALDLFMQQTADPAGIISPELTDKAEASIGSTLQVPVIDYDGTITIGNTRTVTIPDSENNSRLVTIVFATYSWGFTIVPAAYMNNEVSIQADFERKFNKYLYKFGKTLDGAAVAALDANKTQVLNDTLGLYTFAGNVVTADFAKREEIIGDINPMQASNDVYAPLHVVGNTGVESAVRKLAEKGLYNETNKQIQYADKVWHWSNEVANAADRYATAFAVPQGTVGMLTRFEREALLRSRSRTGHEWDIDTLPMLEMPVGTYYYESVGDFSGIAGAATADLTRAKKEHYGFAVDVAFVVAENSDAANNPGAILKLDIKTEGAV